MLLAILENYCLLLPNTLLKFEGRLRRQWVHTPSRGNSTFAHMYLRGDGMLLLQIPAISGPVPSCVTYEYIKSPIK